MTGITEIESMAEPITWINPVDEEIGEITSLSGIRVHPITGRREFHDGIDIAVPTGTPIVAPKDGYVIALGFSESFGYFVRLSHTNGYLSFYAHLYSISVELGEQVTQSQQIAYSGNTGMSTGPHLHFSIFRDGQFVNPIQYVTLPLRL